MATAKKQRRLFRYKVIRHPQKSIPETGGATGMAPMAVRDKALTAIFSRKVAYLEKELGGARLARITHVDRSRIARWKRGAKADPKNRERIDHLEYVLSRLRSYLSSGSEEKWLYGINAHLNNCRPIDFIENGRISEVIAAIEQDQIGSYA